jgi:hypothetical protein
VTFTGHEAGPFSYTDRSASIAATASIRSSCTASPPAHPIISNSRVVEDATAADLAVQNSALKRSLAAMREEMEGLQMRLDHIEIDGASRIVLGVAFVHCELVSRRLSSADLFVLKWYARSD